SEDIVIILNNNDIIECESLNGFINIKINNDALFKYYLTFLNNPLQAEIKGKVLLEYVSANPTGPLHIGHGRWAVIGDCLFRLLKTVGIDVQNEFYINDAGNQINIFNESVNAKKENNPVPENGYGGHFIQNLIDNINNGQTNIDYVLNYQKNTLKKLNCYFDSWFKESKLHNENILNIIKQEFSDYIIEKDGAVWFQTTKFNDDKDRVIKKENGDLTYFAADIVYHLNKIKRGYNSIINIWGADHHGYIERISSVIKAQQTPVEFKVILGQLVNLFKNGEPIRMSKRTGDLIELEEVIDEIGADATRYFLIEKKPELHLDFDLDAAKEKNMSNPVYYIQYAHARICNILLKTNDLELIDGPLNNKDRQLIISGSRYYDVLKDAAISLEPYKLTHFLYQNCKSFHSFYKENQIIYDNKVHQPRLEIIKIQKSIIQHCLNILGISSPEKM
ncbi:MAG: arginine--tRNA ligase, partial [Candidatus Margulisiibacteriota bacterium]